MQKKAGFQFDDTLLEALGEGKGPNITFVGMERNFFGGIRENGPRIR